MSNIEQKEFENASTGSRQDLTRKKSGGRFKKRIIFSAIVLSCTALIMSGAALKSYFSVSVPQGNGASIVTPKLAGFNESNRILEGLASENDSNGHNATNAASPEAAPPAHSEEPPSATENKVVKSAPKVAYLTFDDGPGPYTDKIVEILNQHSIHATFFVIGNQLKGYEDSVKAASESGNYIGLHSMTHNKKNLYESGSSAYFIKEFKREQKMVEKITGHSPSLIRAPYGSKPQINKKFRDDIVESGFKMWDWTVDSKDWQHTGKPDKVLKEIKRQVHRDVEVILFHEKKQTVEALPQIIDYLTNKGYAFAVYKPDRHFSVNFANDSRL